MDSYQVKFNRDHFAALAGAYCQGMKDHLRPRPGRKTMLRQPLAHWGLSSYGAADQMAAVAAALDKISRDLAAFDKKWPGLAEQIEEEEA